MNYYERHIGDYLKDTAHLYLKPHERLHREKRKSDGLVVFRIVRATRWTA